MTRRPAMTERQLQDAIAELARVSVTWSRQSRTRPSVETNRPRWRRPDHPRPWALRHFPAPSWVQHAACAGADTRLFHPPPGRQSKTAKRICARCPVEDTCLAFALVTEKPWLRVGIWGGLSPDERDVLYSLLARTERTPDMTARSEITACEVTTKRREASGR